MNTVRSTIDSLNLFKVINVFNFWLHWVFAAACGLSLIEASGGCSAGRLHGSSPRWLLSCRARARDVDSGVMARGLSCPLARGIFPRQGSDSRPPTLTGRFLTTGLPGKSCGLLLRCLGYAGAYIHTTRQNKLRPL